MVNEKKIPEENVTFSYSRYLLNKSRALVPYLEQGKEGLPYVQIGLERIFKEMGCEDSWIAKMCSDPKYFAGAIQSQLTRYEEFKQESPLENIAKKFSPQFEAFSKGGSKRFNETYKDLMKLTYGEILLKIEELDLDIKGFKFGRISEEKKNELEKQKARYMNVIKDIEGAQNTSILDFDPYLKFTNEQNGFNSRNPEEQKKTA